MPTLSFETINYGSLLYDMHFYWQNLRYFVQCIGSPWVTSEVMLAENQRSAKCKVKSVISEELFCNAQFG